jgi:hypothetical protein
MKKKGQEYTIETYGKVSISSDILFTKAGIEPYLFLAPRFSLPVSEGGKRNEH